MARVTSVASDSEDERQNVSKSANNKSKQSPELEDDQNEEEGEDGDEDEPEYEIERILDAKHGAFPGGRIGYLVKWKGYPESENSWVDERDAGNAQGLIDEYWDNQKKEKKVVKKLSDVSSKRASKPGRKSIARSDSPDVASASAAKKRGRQPKSTVPKEESDVAMGEDEDEPRINKKQRKRNDNLKATSLTSDGDEEEQYSDMTKYMKKENWEDLVDKIDTVERANDGQLWVYFTLKRGERVKESSGVCRKHFPQKLIEFYESNLRWKQTDSPDSP